MNLFFKIVEVCNVNDFKALDEYNMVKGTQQFLYFQLFTESSCGATRYIPQGTANSIIVELDHIDDFKKVRRTAVQAFPGDGSIFRITLGASDCVCYNGMTVISQETTAPQPMIEYKFNMKTAIRVAPTGSEKRFV